MRYTVLNIDVFYAKPNTLPYYSVFTLYFSSSHVINSGTECVAAFHALRDEPFEHSNMCSTPKKMPVSYELCDIDIIAHFNRKPGHHNTNPQCAKVILESSIFYHNM